MLGFDGCVQTSPVAVSRGCSPAAVLRPLIAVASLAAEHGLQNGWAAAAAAHGLNRSQADGIFLDQGAN